MKKILTIAAILATAAGAYAQGSVVFNNVVTGVISTRVYDFDPANPAVQQVGNTATDTPAGTTVYGGAKLAGTGYSAQLWGGAGAGATTLAPMVDANNNPVTTTFRTGGAAGVVVAVGNPQIAGAAAGTAGTLQLRAWNNAGGTITSYDAATIRGASPSFTIDKLGGGTVTSPNLVGLQSFSLTSAAVPEPTTIALGVMGIGALLFRRRK